MTIEYDQVTIEIVNTVALYLSRLESGDKFDVTGRLFMLDKVSVMVQAQQPIRFVLPAFPMKSPSPSKVLGPLPDRGEEIALLQLENFCRSIQDVYVHGAIVIIVSDGVVYQDLLGVSEYDFKAYQQELRVLALKRLGLTRIRFTDCVDMMRSVQANISAVPETLEEIRWHLWSPDFQSQNTTVVRSSDSVCLTPNEQSVYRGFIKFLEIDLKHSPKFMAMSRSQQRKQYAKIAKEMICRGRCFSALIDRAFPCLLRLSIHPYDNSSPKFSFRLFPRPLDRLMTPWHNIVLERSRGDAIVGSLSSMGDHQSNIEIRSKYDRPWCLLECSPEIKSLRERGVTIDRLYPFGMVLNANNCNESGHQQSIADLRLSDLRRLTLDHSLVLLRGFRPLSIDAFRAAAKQIGQIQEWVFGDLLVVKESTERDLNNVCTREAMPMHFDGTFKTITDPISGKQVPNAPLFQFFQCIKSTDATDNDGQTLFADTSRILQHPALLNIPASCTIDDKCSVQCEIFTPKNESFGGAKVSVPLIYNHPLTGRKIMRFHEPWSAQRTALNPTLVSLTGELTADESDELCARITRLLYSRQFCVYHSWQPGDFIIADNYSLLHTRQAFRDGNRELWRIHLN